MDKFDVFIGRAYVVIGALVMTAKSVDYAFEGGWWWWIIASANLYMAVIMGKDGVK